MVVGLSWDSGRVSAWRVFRGMFWWRTLVKGAFSAMLNDTDSETEFALVVTCGGCGSPVEEWWWW